jgi:hypothetical protein
MKRHTDRIIYLALKLSPLGVQVETMVKYTIFTYQEKSVKFYKTKVEDQDGNSYPLRYSAIDQERQLRNLLGLPNQ